MIHEPETLRQLTEAGRRAITRAHVKMCAPLDDGPEPRSLADIAEQLRQRLDKLPQAIKWPEQIKRKVLRVETPLSAQIRVELGEERWAELNEEWE